MSTSRWDEVTILRKRVPPRDQGSKPGTGSSKDQNPIPGSQKKTIPPNKNKEALDPRFAAKIDNETETFNLKTIGVATGKAIQKARAAKGLSQKELAQLVNEKVAIIVECESGKLANASQQVINKLERILEVSLRGKNMGNPIAKKPPPTKTTSGTSGKSPAKK